MSETNYSLSLKLGSLLESNNLKIAVAESCTGGGLASEITSVTGSSAWFDRGFVTYSDASKIELLNVNPETLSKYGAVSAETARAMAMGVMAHSSADFALSITGIAGPTGGTPDKPVGLVWFGLAQKKGGCETRSQHYASGRAHVRHCAIRFALNWLLEIA